MFFALVAFGLAKVAITIYTFITLPLYAIIQLPCGSRDQG